MAKDKAGLYVDTQDLFRLLYETQFEIPKRDRIALTNRMLDHCEKIIGYFALTATATRTGSNIRSTA